MYLRNYGDAKNLHGLVDHVLVDCEGCSDDAEKWTQGLDKLLKNQQQVTHRRYLASDNSASK